jgi:anti-sigma factor RsiW
MRCSSCESWLDSYVEATLEPLRAGAVAAHLQSCAACEALHRRLRVVDALLMTAHAAELDGDFTIRVMTEIRTLPAPQPQRRPLLPLAAFYLVAAWIAAAAAFVLVRPGTPLRVCAVARATGGLLAALQQGVHALWPIAPVALPVVVSVLTIDVLLFAAVVVFYRRVRPRLRAYLTVPAEAQ